MVPRRGTGDKIKGKVKEAVGSVTGSDHLRKEGQAQQHKGHHEQQAAEARAVVEKHNSRLSFRGRGTGTAGSPT
jgi:uncharacterized protein YjbJ (UPF0337 family)